MIDDAIDELTKQLIEKDMDLRKNDSTEFIRIKKVELYRFCIKLLKVLKDLDDNPKK